MPNARRRLSDLSDEKRALLARKLRERRKLAVTGQSDLPQIEPDSESRFAPFNLTDLQHAYWLGRSTAFALGNLASKAYVEVESQDVRLDELAEAWRSLITRHDMLRVVLSEDGEQRVLASAPHYEVAVLDLRQAPESSVSALSEVQREMLADSRPASEWPQTDLRVTLLPGGLARLHFCFDLLNVDAGSIGTLLRELHDLYQGSGGLESPPDLTFKDYASRIIADRDSRRYNDSKEYWVARAADFPSAPQLPLAANPESFTRPWFVRLQRVLGSEVFDQLKVKASKQHLTVNTVLLTAYAEVLGVWSRRQHFAINIPLPNRLPVNKDIDRVVGPFTSVELLEVDHRKRGGFLGRAEALQERLLEDLSHRHYDGVEFMRELARVKGSPAEAAMPVVFTSLIDGKYNEAFAQFGSIKSSINQTAQVFMDLHVDDQDGALVVKWDSVEGLFPEGLVEDMLDSYYDLITRLAALDDWDEVRLSLPREQQEGRERINDTAVERPSTSIYEQFAEQAEARPENPAVVTKDRVLTYDDLRRRSNRLARQLREAGARRNRTVAIVMEKGWEQVVAVLGVIQSGAAYLPVDPALPIERLRHLLEHGEAQFAVTQPWLSDRLSWPNDVSRFVVESDESGDLEEAHLTSVNEPGDLAYVLYTSGSTGKPKGAMLEHRNVTNRMLDVIERFQITPEDRAIAVTSLQHDLSVFDLFAMLLSGGSIAIPDAKSSRDPSHWLELCVRHEVTLWNSVPAFMEMFVDHLENTPGSEPPTRLRSVMLSGDFIPVGLPDRIRERMPECRVIGLGGPTETTVWDICFPIGDVDPSWQSIPYGRPMENSQYYVLNDALNSCPDWVAGELYIGGGGVGRGYWRDEKRTNERYIIHPDTAERLYRSGDLGRWLPDGNIEILGRADFQIKIRGYRIEPGEIEATLEQHPDVKSAVAVAAGDTPRDRQLVAYVATGIEQPTKSAGQGMDDHGRLEFKLRRHGVRSDLADGASIELPRSGVSEEALERTFLTRQSYRSFEQKPMTLDSFSATLSDLCSLDTDSLAFPKHRYPSGGGLYPVQTYVYVQPGRVEGVPAGTYYHDPSTHRLVELDSAARLEREIVTANNRPMFDGSAFMILFVGRMSAVEPLYGELARDFCLLEAGYMSQLLMTEGHDRSVGFCAVGSAVFDQQLRDAFRLAESDVYAHALLGGPITEEQKSRFSLLDDSGISSPVSGDGPGEDLRTDLKGFLSERLPEYMVPSTFVLLDELPLTPNGKLDRRSLPDPDESRVTAPFVPPEGNLEKTIAEVFQTVLGLEQVGVKDNFFDLGGNSLLVLKAHQQLKRELEEDFSVIEMFANPTVAALSEFLAKESTDVLDASMARAEARRSRRGRGRRPDR